MDKKIKEKRQNIFNINLFTSVSYKYKNYIK